MSSEFNPRVISLGGGHGLAATLSAVRRITSEITAIVTVQIMVDQVGVCAMNSQYFLQEI